MKMKTLLEKFSYFFESAVVTLISAFFVTSVVYAATTIGAHINTGGNLDVDGTSSATNATTTGYLYVGVGITNQPGFDFGQGDLLVSDDFYVNSQATTSASLWVGSGGAAANLNLAGGDLYVQDDVEIDGSATTTSLYLSNDLTIVGHASTTCDLRTDDALIFGGTVHLTTSTATTTDGIFVDMPYNGTATTTVSFGENVGVA